MRIIALGQPHAGDDGVAWFIANELQKVSNCNIYTVDDASHVISLLCTKETVILVDAFVSNGNIGQVLYLPKFELQEDFVKPVSTHAMSLSDAVTLARVLHEAEVSDDIRFVGVEILAPTHFQQGLSPLVQSGALKAVEKILDVVEHRMCC